MYISKYVPGMYHPSLELGFWFPRVSPSPILPLKLVSRTAKRASWCYRTPRYLSGFWLFGMRYVHGYTHTPLVPTPLLSQYCSIASFFTVSPIQPQLQCRVGSPSRAYLSNTHLIFSSIIGVVIVSL